MRKLILAVCCIGLLSACGRHEATITIKTERLDSFFACKSPFPLTTKDNTFKREDGLILHYNFAVTKGEYPPPECECTYLGNGKVYMVDNTLQ